MNKLFNNLLSILSIIFLMSKLFNSLFSILSNLFNFHNSALTITLLDLMFGINHLEVMDVLKDKVKKKQYFYWPLVAVIKFLALCSGEGGRKKHRYELTTRNDIIFGGNTVIFIVRKAGTASKS